MAVSASTHDSSSEIPITANNENRNSPVASGLSPMPAKAMIPITVAPKSGICVLLAASSAASRLSLPRRIAICIPSATTMALSTNIPIAIINAPREIRSISMEKIAIKNNVPTTVKSSVTPTTTAARHPMNSARTITTIVTDIARLIRNAFDASSTTTCCW